MTDADHSSRRLWRRIADFPLGALVLAVALYAAAAVLGFAVGDEVIPLGQPATAAEQMVVMLVIVLTAYKLGIRRLGEPPRDDLPKQGAARKLAVGLIIGALLYGLVAAVAAAIGVYRVTGSGGASMLAVGLISDGIMPGVMEELFFRGIIQRYLEELLGSWGGLALASLAFGFAHFFNPGATVQACLWIAIEGGIMLGGAYMLTRSLWMPIGIHAAWNFIQGPILGVPVSGNPPHGIVQAKLSGPAILSGGSFGLEASVIALVIATAAGAWFVWLAVRKGRLVKPWWVEWRAARAS
jgi:membrane protease YdiL (CAAX protease family)